MLSHAALAQRAPDAELEAVREQIDALEARIATETRRRDDGAAELRRLELAAAEKDAAVAALDADLATSRQRERTLQADAARVRNEMLGEQDLLAEQVRLSYRTGRQEIFKLLLSQEDPADLGRMLTYYDYLNRARGLRIAVAGSELSTLERLSAEAREAGEEVARLRDRRAGELAALSAARAGRAALIDRLDDSIAEAGGEISELRAEEARLGELIEELAVALQGFPVESEAPFESWKGRLSWPLDGALAADFGDLREGGPLRWNGVVLEAAAGTPVRAVYHGRVAFADWLPGLGLLLVLDHGDQYMSLYGHNQSLLREPGDWVSPGEVVAEVGDSGGRREPALYFEIRHRGEPENPHGWMP